MSLLIPLAENLGVSVTELLEGRRLTEAEEMKPEQVEQLVKKAITISENTPQTLKRRGMIFGLCAMVSLMEMGIGGWLVGALGHQMTMDLMVLEILGFVFGIYLWFVVEETLPDYYDQNSIGTYYKGGFRISLPGVSFNNANWLKILRAMRIWSLVTLLTVPLISAAISLQPWGMAWELGLYIAALAGNLAGLFLPVYLLGRRKTGKEKSKKEKASLLAALLVIPLVLVLTWFTGGGEQFSGVRVGYRSGKGRQYWSASYVRLDGQMGKTLYPEDGETPYLLSVQTEEGSLAMTLTGENGEILFSMEEIPTGTYSVTLEGKTSVSIQAEDHWGSFSLEPK